MDVADKRLVGNGAYTWSQAGALDGCGVVNTPVGFCVFGS